MCPLSQPLVRCCGAEGRECRGAGEEHACVCIFTECRIWPVMGPLCLSPHSSEIAIRSLAHARALSFPRSLARSLTRSRVLSFLLSFLLSLSLSRTRVLALLVRARSLCLARSPALSRSLPLSLSRAPTLSVTCRRQRYRSSP